MGAPSPILVFSHLRWNFVYQRPQPCVVAARPPPPGLLY